MVKVKNKFAPNAVIDGLEAYTEDKRAWQCGPSISRTKKGRLFITFMSGGIYEPDPRNHGAMIYSDDNGDTWSDPILVIESKRTERLRTTDPETWIAPDGALWLFWEETPYPAGLALPNYEQKIDMENDSEYHIWENRGRFYAAICRDPDADELVFEEPRYLFNGCMQNKPFVTDSGRWIFGAFIAGQRRYYQFYYSDDEGRTILPCQKIYGRADGRAFDEPNFYKTSDGRIAVVVRTTPPLYKRMFSSDDGYSWTAPEDFLPTSSQRPCTMTCQSGGAFMVMSIDAKARNGFKLMYSDDGLDFSQVMILDDRQRISYAEMVDDENETLYIAYDRERNNKVLKSLVTGRSESAKEILFARIPKAAWQNGIVTPDTVRARVITKARINELDNIYTREK